jgi:hypothetical protein
VKITSSSSEGLGLVSSMDTTYLIPTIDEFNDYITPE